MKLTGASTLLILVGLFFAGGVYSFWKQRKPRGVIWVMALTSVMSLAAGLLRL